jgi:hypothetical protein
VPLTTCIIDNLLVYIDAVMSNNKDDKFHEKEEDKKRPPLSHVPWPNRNEVRRSKDESAFYEEEKEEIKAITDTPGHVPWSNPNETTARNEAPGTVHELDTKECIDIKDPRKYGAVGHVEFHSTGSDASPAQSPNVRNSTHEPVLPGAFRAGGFDIEEGYEEDDWTITIGDEKHGTIEPSPPTLTAELVNTEQEENRVLQKAVQNFLQNAAVGEVVPEVPEVAPDKGRRRKFASLFLLLFILIVVGVVLAITLRPDSEPSTTTQAPTTTTQAPTTTPIPKDLSDLITAASYDGGEALATPSTSQYMALEWLAGNENLANYTDQEKIQRYALATLYYSTKGDTSWASNDFWISNADVCGKWYQYNDTTIECIDGAVSSLTLSDNGLQGTIPPEIGMLSDSLGKFTFEKKRCQTVCHSIPWLISCFFTPQWHYGLIIMSWKERFRMRLEN